jgi:hypothetical protein
MVAIVVTTVVTTIVVTTIVRIATPAMVTTVTMIAI